MTRSDLFKRMIQPFHSDLEKMSDRRAAERMCDLLQVLTGDLAAFCRERQSQNDSWGDAAADCSSISASIRDVHLSVKEVA